MYLEHFGLKEAPFTITPHTDFFFSGANRGVTLEALLYAVTHGEGIVKVSGEVGSGKTMLCRVLMERFPDNIETIYLAIPSLSRDEMLEAICTDLGVETSASSPNALLKSLQEHLLRLHSEGKRVVALIDEAHAMPVESLEEIRLLSNLETNTSKLLQLVLFGQPELDEKLATQQLRQLRERITHSFRLSPLSLKDVHEYLRHRLRAAGYKGAEVFNHACVKLITEASRGYTRRINIIADKSLLVAFSQNTHSVTLAHVKAAIHDSEFASIRPKRSHTHWIAGTAIGIGLALGVVGTLAGIKIYEKGLIKASEGQDLVQQKSEPRVVPIVSSAETKVNTVQTAVPVRLGIDDYLSRSAQWLANEDNHHWVIQLMLADQSEPNVVLNFVRDSGKILDQNNIHIYPLEINSVEKLGVLYGSFETRSAAVDALKTLPDQITHFKPYLRSIPAIRTEAKPLNIAKSE